MGKKSKAVKQFSKSKQKSLKKEKTGLILLNMLSE